MTTTRSDVLPFALQYLTFFFLAPPTFQEDGVVSVFDAIDILFRSP
jgi:hypothetical protein